MKDGFRKYLAQPEEVLAKKWAAPFRPWLAHPNFWHLNRRSVPGAVAIGLFCGLIPGPFQMLSALLCAIPFRSNIPLAMAVTWYTNPLTIVPIYLIAYRFGRSLLGHDGSDARATAFEWEWSLTGAWQWMQSLGKPLGIGLLALAVTLAVIGYFITRIAWRLYVIAAWRRRAARSSTSR